MGHKLNGVVALGRSSAAHCSAWGWWETALNKDTASLECRASGAQFVRAYRQMYAVAYSLLKAWKCAYASLCSLKVILLPMLYQTPEPLA